MLDTGTIRTAFTVIAVTLLLLLYFALYRPTRAKYAGLWCLALALFMVGDTLYFLDHTALQRVANPLGNVLIVLGSAAVWCGACSLRQHRPRTWMLAAGPVAAAIAAVPDHPATNTWAGGAVFLAAVGVYFALSSLAMWRLSRSEEPTHTGSDDVYRVLVVAITAVVALLALFYFGRAGALLVQGRDGAVFTTWFGTAATMLVQIVLLVVVAFTVSALSNEQLVRELRARATRDGLTGLLNRTEFFHQARERVAECGRGGDGYVLVMADLDHFKDINDRFGHGAGDRALRSFAKACLSVLRAGDVIGRVGGEEFAILLPDTAPVDAERITQRISHRYRFTVPISGVEATVSYGIAPLEAGLDLETVLARADAALYRAKAEGRDRAMHHRG